MFCFFKKKENKRKKRSKNPEKIIAGIGSLTLKIRQSECHFCIYKGETYIPVEKTGEGCEPDDRRTFLNRLKEKKVVNKISEFGDVRSTELK